MPAIRASKTIECVVGELEGTLVKEPDPFPYLMLVAFEASGPIRFALLLLFWPVVCFLALLGLRDVGFKLAIFIAVVGVRVSEIEYVGRAVLPKFYMDHIDLDAWRVFSEYGKKVVVSKYPRVMVEWFAKEHLGANHVFGCELVVNRFGRATGFVTYVDELFRVEEVFGEKELCLGLGRPNSEIVFASTTFMSLCEEKCIPPFSSELFTEGSHLKHPSPVVFHDGRLAIFPKPAMAFLFLLWFPVGVIIAIIRLLLMTVLLPICVIPYENLLYCVFVKVKGNLPKPPQPTSPSSRGVLFVCNHRNLFDPVIVSMVLERKLAAVTYSLSRFTEFISPIRTVRLTRDRHVDAKRIEAELKRGDTIIFPEGTTCREAYLLRFSALFAELTDQIVPVALHYKPTFFHPTKARGWKGFDPFCLHMNPFSFYEITFLDQLPFDSTFEGGKSSYDVANDVQRSLATTLGFECTNFTRKDKYMLLKGSDGRV